MMLAVGLIPRFQVKRAFSVAERRLKLESIFCQRESSGVVTRCKYL